MSADSSTGASPSARDGWRLQRFLARAGWGSRRGCESLVLAGRVRVNGVPVTQLGARVVPGRDRVAVDGLPVELPVTRHFVLNKPPRCLCTRHDPRGRPTIYDWIQRQGVDGDALAYVGRLDWASEGLLFLTTDGWLAARMAHPRYHLRRTYHVWIAGAWTRELTDQLLAGILDPQLGLPLRGRRVRTLATAAGAPATRLEIQLDEGRNRQIRRMMKALGRNVVRLVRTRMGPLTLRGVGPGELRPAAAAELKALRRQLGWEEPALG